MPFVPTDLPGLKLWLDALDESTLDSPTGLTHGWQDKSGLGHHAVCQTGRPLGIHTNPTDASLRILRVVGGSGATGGYVRADAVAPILNSPFTMFVVAAFPTRTNQTLVGAGNAGSSVPSYSVLNNGGRYQLSVRSAGGVTSITNSTANVSNDLAIYRMSYTGSQVQLHRNGTLLVSASYSAGNDLTQFGLGVLPRNVMVNCGDLLVAEVLLYDTSLSGGDVTAVESYLQRHLGVVAGAYGLPGFWPLAQVPKLARFTRLGTAFGSTYDASRHRCAGANKVYHVDPVLGGDGHPGTADQPFRSIDAALSQPDVDGVCLAPGLYHKNAAWSSYTKPDRSVSIWCPTGRAVICHAEDVTAWTKTSGRTFVYEFARASAPVEVFDLTRTDADGRALPYTSAASIAACDATAGSWHDNGTTVYVHPWDDRPADRDVVVRLGTVAPALPFVTPFHFLSLENVTFYGASLLPPAPADVEHCCYYFRRVHDFSAGEWSWSGADEVYLSECVRTNCTDDVFDYRGDVIGIEMDSIAQSNGGGDTANATTGHVSATVIRLRGNYRNGRRVAHDINDTRNWYLACRFQDALVGGENTGVGVTAGFNDSTPSSVMTQLEFCQFAGNAIDIIAGNGAAMTCRGIHPLVVSSVVHANGSLTFLEIPACAAVYRRRRACRQGISL